MRRRAESVRASRGSKTTPSHSSCEIDPYDRRQSDNRMWRRLRFFGEICPRSLRGAFCLLKMKKRRPQEESAFWSWPGALSAPAGIAHRIELSDPGCQTPQTLQLRIVNRPISRCQRLCGSGSVEISASRRELPNMRSQQEPETREFCASRSGIATR